MRPRESRRSGIGAALIASAALFMCSGCISSTLGYQFHPERTHYTMFDDFFGVEVRHVKHVKDTIWGMHVFGMQVKRPSVRAFIDKAVGDNPNHYVSDLNIHTDVQGTFIFTVIAGLMYLPKVTVEFDVVELLPPSTSEAVSLKSHEMRTWRSGESAEFARLDSEP